MRASYSISTCQTGNRKAEPSAGSWKPEAGNVLGLVRCDRERPRMHAAERGRKQLVFKLSRNDFRRSGISTKVRLPWILRIFLEAEAIDFSLPGEGTVNSVEEVVSGVFLIYGEMDADLLTTGDLDIVVTETVGKVCKNFERTSGAPTLTKMFVDVRTVGQRRLGMNYTWQMLPPIEAGKDCINRLAMVSFGPKEPPFDKFPAPPVRALFEAEMRLHPPTRFLNMTGWTLSLQNMSCDERQVIKHWNHSRSIDVFPTEEPECLGTDSVDWEPNLEGEFDLNEVGGCDLAGSNPCVCAALTNCEWVTSVSGVPRCVYTSRPGVPCEACPNQPQCVITPEKECEMKSTPCACVLRGGGCNWDMATSRCYFDVTASTACIACSRQGFCSLPAVRSKQPENLALMGQEEVGWFINVTFDRDIEFLRLGLGSGIMLQCRSNRPGDWAPTFELEYGQLVIDGSMLHINVRGLPNDERRDCDLVIANNAVRDSQDRLPFNGLEDNVIFVTLPDGIPPEVVSFEPANSARGVSLATTVHFHFNENVRFYSIGYLELYILGGNRTDRAADIKIAEISVWDEAVAIDRDNRNIMHVQLTGLLSTSTYYSLTIPPQTISDISSNPFGGIDRGVYIFQTGAEEIVEELVDDTEEETLTFTIVLAAVGVLVLAMAVVAAYLVLETVRKTRRRARVVARREEKMEEAVIESNAPETSRSTKAADLNLGSELEEEWPVSLAPSLKSPTSATASSPKTVQSSGQLLSPQMSPKGRPSVQVFSKPEELKAQVHDQLRHSGNVVSLADLHVKSNSMMRTIGGKVEDRSRGRGSRPTTSGSVTAPSSPLARRHSMTLSPTSPKVEDRRKLKSAQGTWNYTNVKYRVNAGIAEVNAQKVVTDSLCEAYDVQQTSSQNNQPSLFAKQLAYMLAQITDGAARAIVRNEDTENGFEIWRRLYNQFSLPTRARATNLLNEIIAFRLRIWRRLYNQFSLPTRARATNLLNEIIAFRLRQDHLESDLSDFIILKNRHEKTTGVPLDNDLLITLIMQKTTGPLQQHLTLNVRNITTFTEALEIVYSYIKSRHLVVESRNDGPVDMNIGALKGRKGYGYKGKGQGKGKGRMYKGKGKERKEKE
eukprot:s1993_g24.t2